MLVLLAVGSLTACADPMLDESGLDQADDEAGSEDAEVDLQTTEQAIIKGTLFTTAADQHGIAALYALVPEFNEWRQVCTATLLTNSHILTAKHCFTHPDLPNDDIAKWGLRLGSEWRNLQWATFSPNGDDAALVGVGTPFTIRGKTTGFRRHLWVGEANKRVRAVGYGPATSGTKSAPSTKCNSKTQGCWADPRPLRTSLHTSQIKEGWANGEDLWVGVNSSGQLPTFGDSGGPLILSPSNSSLTFLELPLVGVATALFNKDETNGFPTAHAHYVPGVNNMYWLCSIGNCAPQGF